ncbi:MAG: pro-sigmaK processing inhibitor BofA family protein [Ruminococcus sp.]
MNVWISVLIMAVTFLLYSIVYSFAKKKKPLRRAFLTMVLGVLTLAALNISGIFTGVSLPVSAMSLCVSTCLGVPGVTAMLIIANFL